MAQRQIGDETFNLVMVADPSGTPVDPAGGGGGADRELVVTTYVVKTAFTGASIGDTVTLTQVIDVSGTPSTVANIWRNQTTAADLSPAPSSVNLELVGSQALTNTQLRASPVSVSLPALTTATETYAVETGAFTIAAGALAYAVINTGAASFDFQGVTIPLAVLAVSGDSLGSKTYPAMSGDATGTTVIVKRTA